MALKPVPVDQRTGNPEERARALAADEADRKARPQHWGGVPGEGGPPTQVEQAVKAAVKQLRAEGVDAKK